MRKQNTCFLP